MIIKASVTVCLIIALFAAPAVLLSDSFEVSGRGEPMTTFSNPMTLATLSFDLYNILNQWVPIGTHEAYAIPNANQSLAPAPGVDNFTTTTTGSLLSYDNPAYGLRIDYPSDWSVTPGNTTSGITNVATFYSPENDDYVSLTLYVEDLSVTGLSPNLSAYADYWTATYNSSVNYPGFALNSSETNRTLSGSPAYSTVGTYNDPILGLRNLMDTGTIRDNLAYSTQVIVSPTKYNEYQQTIDSMINSLEISK